MSEARSTAAVRALCPHCGLCCNGVLFADVHLQPADEVDSLNAAGVPIRRRGNSRCFAQPCRALHVDGRCQVYESRPAMCRQFECGVLKEVAAGRLAESDALQLIQRVRKLAGRVHTLLGASGNSEQHRPLAKRYQSVMRQPIDLAAREESGDIRGNLMMAVHELMEIVQKRFLRVDTVGNEATPEF